MTADEMAALHARAFAGAGRAWSAAEIAALLESRGVFACGDARCFALARVIADEAEILTIATDPDARRKGRARDVLATLETRAAGLGATRVFLEVAEDNRAARGLYQGAGYAQTARRAGYYRREDGPRVDALILAKPLG